MKNIVDTASVCLCVHISQPPEYDAGHNSRGRTSGRRMADQ